uniref:very-long-chain (3R)-3-hydroxyacyl-CoA dehydratase 1 isoform X2 n=1 Tax=Pristiophorus japonicus TaxID=55135 RepID=UPI00398E8A47
MAPSEEDGSVEEKENKKKTLSPLATAWLTFYNITMTAGWLVLAVAMIRFSYQKRTHKGLYRNIQKTLKFFQTFALLEIIHCAAGIVRTSVLVTGVQVMSRIFMVWFVVHSIRPIQNEESVVLFLVTWAVTEITRYSFYTFNLLNHLPYFIKWARSWPRSLFAYLCCCSLLALLWQPMKGIDCTNAEYMNNFVTNMFLVLL